MTEKSLATTKGKAHALDALAMRREENSKKERIDNSQLPAGSPMYYYCISCNGISDIKPEGWFLGSVAKLCKECQALKDLDWLE